MFALSFLEEASIEEVMPILKKMYSSFGLRSFILLNNKEWLNITTVIEFTRRSVDNLALEYQSQLEKIGGVPSDRSQIILQPKKIDEIDRVMAELRKGCLTLRDLETVLMSKKRDLTDVKLRHSSIALLLGEQLEYNCYSAVLNMDTSPRQFINNSGISPLVLKIPNLDDLFRSWLGLENSFSTINVAFVFPIYAKIESVKYSGGNEVKIILKVHRSLLTNSSLCFQRRSNADRIIVEQMEYPLASYEEPTQEGFAYMIISHSFSGLELYDMVHILVLHSELGVLNEAQLRVQEYSALNPDTFSKVFSLFNAGKRIENHLFNPKSATEFEAAVSWLLELSGIRTIKLNKILKGDEVLMEDGIQRGSADILVFDPERKLLAIIDCTTGVPSEMDGILNTANCVSRKLNCHVSKIIFSCVEAPMAKAKAKENGIKILDKLDLQKIYNEFERGSRFLDLS